MIFPKGHLKPHSFLNEPIPINIPKSAPVSREEHYTPHTSKTSSSLISRAENVTFPPPASRRHASPSREGGGRRRSPPGDADGWRNSHDSLGRTSCMIAEWMPPEYCASVALTDAITLSWKRWRKLRCTRRRDAFVLICMSNWEVDLNFKCFLDTEVSYLNTFFPELRIEQCIQIFSDVISN